MKKIILIILISGSIFIYSDKKTEKIESEIKKIDKNKECRRGKPGHSLFI